jgi:pyruvate, orthophosphate dikinase
MTKPKDGMPVSTNIHGEKTVDHKWVYLFSAEKNEGHKGMKNLLGGKGANLAEMCGLKLPVPPGFTVSTEACLDYEKNQKKLSPEIKEQVMIALGEVEVMTGKKFGCETRPLLFSVRSGARVSMPGMMDTVLNLGLNDKTVLALSQLMNNERFAWDSYRRFIQMYANVVMGMNGSLLESSLEDLKERKGVHEDTDLDAEDLKGLVKEYKSLIQGELGQNFPQDPMEQLWRAISAVFNSWNNSRARKYREIHGFDHSWGTAVNVQAMVFGNLGPDCGTGVCFTRDPGNGEKRFFGEYLMNAQGEDVVAGIRTPAPINQDSCNDTNGKLKTLQEVLPKTYNDLVVVYQQLEKHYRDMQDIEFTIEKEKLYVLQTRSGKRTTQAALKIAVDMVSEGLITQEEALMRVKPQDLDQLLHPRLDPKAKKVVLAKGLPASPGAATGKIVFSADNAVEWQKSGEKVLLVRIETSPEDISGMVASQGILTARGGMTSHAAVVARGMGKPCVAGCSALVINYQNKEMMVAGKVFKEGDYLTLDGATGEIIEGEVKTVSAELSNYFGEFMAMADQVRTLKVRTNADNPEDAAIALRFGAEGIGLCRTEHMFFDPERILAVREMIFAQNERDREKALQKILPFQKKDFIGLFQVMKGHPVNIRLLDPPLHEFLPHAEHERSQLAESLGLSLNEIKERGEQLHEFNPMLGHRGCRLAVTYPEIYKMQVQAISLAAIEVVKSGSPVKVEIMIPLIAEEMELSLLRKDAEKIVKDLCLEHKTDFSYKIGTMIELPRAAIMAGELAHDAEFFSFGTNDLTQTTYGLSRDDAGKFLPTYLQKNILKVDPFVSLDQKGVGFLMSHAVKEGKKTRSDIHIGICGEHGGDPETIHFCHKIGLDYVSCSPFRVPIARLSAAQATILAKK